MKENAKRIICFSPTGNCKKVALALAERGDDLRDITMPEKRENPPVFGQNEMTVFVMPVYNRGIPDACAEYIKSLDGKGGFASVICVYGGVTKGKSLQKAAKLLTKSNFRVAKGAYVPAPHFYSKEKFNVLSQERLQRIKAFFDGEFAAKAILSLSGGEFSIQPFLRVITGSCRVDFSLCTACGKCKEVCPVNAVRSDFSSAGNCILCGACVNACPARARNIRFHTPVPLLFIKANCKHRDDEFYDFKLPSD